MAAEPYFKRYDSSDCNLKSEVQDIRDYLDNYGHVNCSNYKLWFLWQEFSEELYRASFMQITSELLEKFMVWLENKLKPVTNQDSVEKAENVQLYEISYFDLNTNKCVHVATYAFTSFAEAKAFAKSDVTTKNGVALYRPVVRRVRA